jgi:hypothetical protein
MPVGVPPRRSRRHAEYRSRSRACPTKTRGRGRSAGDGDREGASECAMVRGTNQQRSEHGVRPTEGRHGPDRIASTTALHLQLHCIYTALHLHLHCIYNRIASTSTPALHPQPQCTYNRIASTPAVHLQPHHIYNRIASATHRLEATPWTRR